MYIVFVADSQGPCNQSRRVGVENQIHCCTCLILCFKHVVDGGLLSITSTHRPILNPMHATSMLHSPQGVLCHEVGYLKKLKILSLKENKLTGLPASLGGCGAMIECHVGERAPQRGGWCSLCMDQSTPARTALPQILCTVWHQCWATKAAET